MYGNSAEMADQRILILALNVSQCRVQTGGTAGMDAKQNWWQWAGTLNNTIISSTAGSGAAGFVSLDFLSDPLQYNDHCNL